jgi:hypothetical protein
MGTDQIVADATGAHGCLCRGQSLKVGDIDHIICRLGSEISPTADVTTTQALTTTKVFTTTIADTETEPAETTARRTTTAAAVTTTKVFETTTTVSTMTTPAAVSEKILPYQDYAGVDDSVCNVIGAQMYAAPGETISYPVYLYHNPGYCSSGIAVDFDSKLERVLDEYDRIIIRQGVASDQLTATYSYK